MGNTALDVGVTRNKIAIAGSRTLDNLDNSQLAVAAPRTPRKPFQ